MSVLKKIAAGLMALTMLFSFAACSDTSWAAKADGYQVNAGVYIYYTLVAYYDAQSKAGKDSADSADDSSSDSAASETTVTTSEDDLFKATIDGKNVRTWIQDDASDSVKKFVAIQKEFAALGLTLTDTQKAQINSALENTWASNEQLFTKNGISKESVKQIIQTSYMSDSIFKSYYGEGGTEAVAQDEIDTYLTDNFLRVKYIAIQLKDGEGNLFKSADKEKAMEMAEDYKERAESESFDDLIKEYNDYYAKVVADAAADDSSSSSSEESSSEAEEDPYANEKILSKDGSEISEKMNKSFFEKCKVGEVSIIEDDEIYYVVEALDMLERTDLIEAQTSSLLYTLRGDTFDEKMEGLAEAVELEKNQSAYDRYDPKKLYLGESA